MKIKINKSKKTVNIEELEINNIEVYNFLSDKKKPEEWVEKAIIIGCAGLKQMTLTDNVDFVEKEFNKFLTESKNAFKKQFDSVDEKIESTFSMDNKTSPVSQFKDLITEYFDARTGKVKELMQGYFDEDTGTIKKLINESFNLDDKNSAFSRLINEIKENSDLEEDEIKKLLDPSNTDSPIQKLRDNILDKISDLKDKEIKDIRDAILKDAAVSKEKEKGTSKGLEFEEEVYDCFESTCKDYSDEVIFVGDKKGVKDKKGDILVDLDSNSKQRLVIECKNSSAYTAKKTKNEIADCIKNRKGRFGIFVFAKKEQVPSSLYPVKIGDSYIITYYSKENMNLAYKLARVLLLKEEISESQEVDFDKISSELIKIEETVRDIDQMHKEVSKILNSGNYLSQHLSKLDHSIELSLNKIKNYLGNNLSEGDFEDETAQDEETEYSGFEENDYAKVVETNIVSAKEMPSGNKTCPICGEKFKSLISTKKYCSYTCRDKFNQLKKNEHLSPPDRILKSKLEDEGLL